MGARDHRPGARPLAFIHSLKACALLPALADIAACRSHSVASWLTVLGRLLSLVGAVPAVLLPVGRDVCAGEHDARSKSAASSPSFISPFVGKSVPL